MGGRALWDVSERVSIVERCYLKKREPQQAMAGLPCPERTCAATLENIDLGHTASLRDVGTRVVLARAGARSRFGRISSRTRGSEQGTYERRCPGSHESSKLYFDRDSSECRAASGPVSFA